MKNLSLMQYVGETYAELIRFRDWWAREHEKNPESYPAEMPSGEWDEQLRMWQSSSEN